ncbi:MAG: Tex family protein [Bacteroidota bacterium]
MTTTYTQLIAERTNISKKQIEKTLALLLEGATIPFIARYRKEATGSLDEVEIAAVQQAHTRLAELDKRRDSILKSIAEQGKLSSELEKRIRNTWDTTELEDLYLPYKRKRKTRASVARERGLFPLAETLWKQQDGNITSIARKYLSEAVPSTEDALQGARDIIAEQINEEERSRTSVRNAFKKYATVRVKVARGKEEAAATYKDYFEFEEPLKRIPSHRLLAILRGEGEGLLRVYIAPDEEETIFQLEKRHLRNRSSEAGKQMVLAIKDGYKRLLAPSIETEFRKLAKTKADTEAIQVFQENLRQLLLSAPLGQKRVLGLDPGYRTGCKMVALDANGNLLENGTIFPHPPQNRYVEATEKIQEWVKRYEIQAIAVGNGTAGKETLAICRAIPFKQPIEVFMVNEAGASIYSASEVAREEFPDHDVTVRGAVSIGRRLMDPLAELVKIDAKSIGVGQYQHDVNQVQLREGLDRVVESCVNAVGININTASKSLLTYVSGLGPTLAQNIVSYRAEHGDFRSRAAIKKVPRMGAKAFEQSAGFLRIHEAKNPLDNTAVHPESYHIVEQMANDQSVKVQELIDRMPLQKAIRLQDYVTSTVGLPTLRDIMQELAKPGLDPRGSAKSFCFAAGINTIEDLNIGMVVPGIVTNVTNFGAFVDIGIKENGLVHISKLANKFVSNPADVVKLQQEVQVKIMDIDRKRGRVTLSMKDV